MRQAVYVWFSLQPPPPHLGVFWGSFLGTLFGYFERLIDALSPYGAPGAASPNLVVPFHFFFRFSGGKLLEHIFDTNSSFFRFIFCFLIFY